MKFYLLFFLKPCTLKDVPMDETAMATMLLAGSFRRVRRKTMTNATAQPDTSVMRKPKRQYIGILYCLPYVVVFLFGMIVPMFYALYLSFFKQSLLGGTTFAGFDNFIRAFKDCLLYTSDAADE